MLLTGLVILAFVIYHLMHFTFGVVDQAHHKWVLTRYVAADPAATPEYDVAAMVVGSFAQWPISLSYVVAMLVLGLHLWHGAGSWLQSLGLNSKRWQRLIHGLGRGRRPW